MQKYFIATISAWQHQIWNETTIIMTLDPPADEMDILDELFKRT